MRFLFLQAYIQLCHYRLQNPVNRYICEMTIPRTVEDCGLRLYILVSVLLLTETRRSIRPPLYINSCFNYI